MPGLLTSRPTMVQVPASSTAAPADDGRGSSVRTGVCGGAAAAAHVRAHARGRAASISGAVRARLEQALRRRPGRQATRSRRRRAPSSWTRPNRLVIAFEDGGELVKKCELALEALAKNDARKWRILQTKGIHFGRGPAGKVAFLFPGQGSQYVNMLADVPDPIVRETFAEADRTMGPILGRPLTSYVYQDQADAAAMEAAEEALKDTTICQPAMVATDIAIMRLLDKHGVVPDVVMGHSLGEWAAAVGARMLDFSEALVAVSARARAMASVSIGDKGKMASVLGAHRRDRAAPARDRRLPHAGQHEQQEADGDRRRQRRRGSRGRVLQPGRA